MDNLLYALKGVDFMKTLKKYKILQMLMGAFLGCLVLSVVLLLTSIATWEQLPAGNLLSKIILTVIPVMFMAGMTFIALVSKSNDLKCVYYPAFIINITSLVLAIIHSPAALNFLKISLGATLLVPIIIYFIMMFLKLSTPNLDPEEKIYVDEKDDPFTDEDFED